MSQSFQSIATKRALACALILTLCAAAMLLAKGALFGAASAAKPVAAVAAALMDCVAPPQADKMIGWWPMDEGLGAAVVHDIMLGQNGTPKPGGVLAIVPDLSGPEPRAGMVTGAHYFFGRQIFTQVPHNAVYNISNGSFTIDLWVNPVQVGPTLLQPLVDKFKLTSPTTGTGYAFYIRGQQLVLDLGYGTGYVTFASSSVIAFNTWQHVAVVADRTNNTVRFYLNGSLVAGGGNLTNTYQNNVLDLLIGGTRNVGPYGEIALDELEIFNTALTTPELFSIFNAGGAGKCKPNCPPQGCATASFAPSVSYVSGTGPLRLATGDFDNDGDLDLAVPNAGNNNVSSLLNNGAGVFSQALNSPIVTAAAPLAIAVGDFNNDGNPDLAVASQQPTAQVTLLRGLGDGQFQSFGTPLTNAGPDPVFPAVADFNKDGKLDLAVVNLGSGNVYVLQGNGAGGFAPFGAPVSAGVQTIALTVGDFNNDGNPDMATANGGSNNASVLLGNGAGGFSAAPPVPVGMSPSCVVTADFNKDGKPDLAVSNRTNGNVTVLRGNGDGSFTSFGNFTSGSIPFTLAVGDFNCDGYPDIAAAQLSSALAVLLGNGSGSFAAPAIFGTPHYGIVAGDFNNDGSPDLAASNSSGNNVAVYLNTCVRKRASTIIINPSSLPSATIGVPYNQTIIASGGNAPYTYSVSNGILKPGFTLNTTTGVLSGTPTTPGTFTFTVTATDANGCQTSIQYTLTCCPVITLTPATVPDGIVGVPYNQPLTASGGATPYMYTATGLPAGLSLAMSGGVLSGNPTATGSFTVVVTAKDANGCTGSRTYTLTIRPCSLRVTKSISSTSVTDTLNPSVTIGEEVCYTLKVELPEGVTPSLTVKDVVPPGMGVTSVVGRLLDFNGIPIANIPLPSITGNVGCPNPAGSNLVLNYGAINVPVDGNPANNYFSLLICATVCDTPANMGMDANNQTMLTNRAMAAIGPQPSLCMANSNDLTLKVVEPKVTIRKTFNPNSVKEGEMTMIMLDVRNNGLSTAYNVVIEDLLPLWLFENGLITTCGTVPAGFTFSKPIVGGNTAATFTGGNLAPGQQLTFCIKVTVKRRCQNDMFVNVAKIKQAWTLPLPPDCAPNCTRPSAVAGVQGRDESGYVSRDKLTIMPALDCTCFGVPGQDGGIYPPAYNAMVLWLKFDEAAGDFAKDSSAYVNDGTLKPATPNGPSHVPGLVPPHALLFDGMNDYVEVNDNSSLDMGTGSFTIDAWINPAPETVASNSGVRTIVDKRTFTFPGDATRPSGGAPVNGVYGYKLYLYNGFLGLQLADGTHQNYGTSTNAIPANTWTHVTAVADRTGANPGVRLYVNGNLVPHGPNPLVTGNLDNDSPLYVGRGVPVDGDFFTGKIDELEIFKLELDEISGVINESLIDGIVNAGSFGKCLAPPPPGCCSKKPQLPNIPGSGGTYSSYTGQVSVATCYADSPNDPVLVVVDLKGENVFPNPFAIEDTNWSTTTPVGALIPKTQFYHHPDWSRANLGDVFGLTLDDKGNIYVAATSVYGFNHTGSLGASAGVIYKIPGDPFSTSPLGVPTVFTSFVNAPTYTIGSNLIPNTGPKLGNIHYDCAHEKIYVSNFEDGLIYRLNPANGNILSTWDHGLQLPNSSLTPFPAKPDSGTPGYTALGRRVWAVQSFNGRLYYSVWNQDTSRHVSGTHLPNEIWSVALDSAGDFVPTTNRRENLLTTNSVPPLSTTIPYLNYSNPVSDISFGPRGTMLLAERSMYNDLFPSAHSSRVLEYQFAGVNNWSPSPNIFRIGNYSNETNAAGGVDYDFAAPLGRVWATGDALRLPQGEAIYGLQGIRKSGNGNAFLDPNATTRSVLIDLNEIINSNDKTQIGDVEIPCPPPDPCLNVNIIISPEMLPSGTAGQNYTSPPFTASGGTAGYTFTATDLPMGLTMSFNGVISGVSMETGDKPITVKVTDANGCMAIKHYTLSFECATNLAIAPNTVPNGMVGMSYSQAFVASGGCGGPFTYSITAGTLPSGLSFNTTTGVLSGTPTTCCDFRFTIKATDKCGCSVEKMYTLIIEGAPATLTGLFNTGVNNSNQVLAVGALDTHYSLTDPTSLLSFGTVLSPTALGVPWVANNTTSMWIGPAALPHLLGTFTYRTTFELPSCTALSGVIRGRWAVDNSAVMTLNGVSVATLPGNLTANFTQFNDFNITTGFQSGTNELLITVNNSSSTTGLRLEWTERNVKCCPCLLALGPNTLPHGVTGESYEQALEVVGGIPGYTFMQTGGTLPPGLAFSNGVFSGTPTTPGTYNVTIKVTDANGCMVTRIITIVIGCHTLELAPRTLPAGVAGVTYNQELTLVGGLSPATWSRVGGTLPPGLILSPTGTLSGTPTTTGRFNFTLQATESNTCAATQAYTFDVLCRTVSVFPPATNPAARVNQSFSTTFTASGAGGPYIFTKIGGLLPPGLTLAANGVLAGTPTAAGRFNFTISATNATGCAGTLQYALTVCADIVISPPTLPTARVNQAYNATFTQTGAAGLTTWRISSGNFAPGLSLNEFNGVLSGTPTAAGDFTFTVSVADENSCPDMRQYTLIVSGSGSGLQYYPLPTPVRLYDTRAPIAGFNPCAYLSAPVPAGGELVRSAFIPCTGIPNTARAIVGNATVIFPNAAGFATLYADGQARPPVSNLNFVAGQVVPNAFTVSLDAQGEFRLYTTAQADFAVDVTGYFAPPGAGGLYYHPLPKPIRLYDTRAPIAGFAPCEYLSQPLSAGNELVKSAFVTNCGGVTIPNNALAITGNATVIFPNAGGFVTIYPDGQARPPVSNLNFAAGQVVPNAFTVGLDAQGEFRLYTTAGADFAVDITGYYSSAASDANGAGLLFTPLGTPFRLYDTRPPISGFTPCEYLSAPIAAGGELVKTAHLTCQTQTIPATAQAIVGNATIIFPTAAGFATLYPDGQTRPPVSNLNYLAGQVVPNAFTVSLNAQGRFRLYTTAQGDFAVDVTGFYAP